MSAHGPGGPSPACPGLSSLLIIALMLTIALSCASCAATKETQTQQTQTSSISGKSDTTSVEIKCTTAETIPESRVNLAVSVDSLLKLPEGAVYRESKDRAHIEAKQKEGVIYITGTCDSLQREVERYEALYHTARDALESYASHSEEEMLKRSPSLCRYLAVFISGVLSGALMMIVIIYKPK